MDDVSKGFMVKAQQCLAKNDFLKALDHLDAVIRRCRPAQRAPIEALDRRAATYIQLQRFADAFQDSKRMIREHKTDARGYLRTVQVLKYQAQEKKDDAYIQSALKVAKSGLDNSRKGDALHYKQLARVHEDLKNPPKVVRHDPAQKLPTELFFEILKHMQTSDLMKARRTSRSWNSMITGNPRFWTSLAITRKFNARGIATLLNFATDASRQCQVTELTIGWLPEPKNAHEVIRNLLKKCSRLRTLDIRTWDNPEKPYWAGVKLSELRSLKLRISRVGGSLKWLSASAKAFPCLEQLALIPDVNIGYPGFDDDSEAIQWPGSLPNLKSFCMHDVAEGHRPLTSVLNLRLDVLATSAPWLERLELKGLDLNLEMSSGEGILTHFKQLKEVRVRNLGSGSLNLSTSSPIDTLELLRPLLWTDSIPRLMWVQAVDQVSSLKRLSISSRLTEPSEWLQFFKVRVLLVLLLGFQKLTTDRNRNAGLRS